MNLKDIAMVMWPYWMLGIFMICATIAAGHGKLVRIEKKAVWSWIKTLFFLTCVRIFIFKMFEDKFAHAAQTVSFIPIPLTLTVFWEDAAHGLPLLLMQKFIGTRWYTWPIHAFLILIVMISFGTGHLYQGILPAILLSFYIPYSIRLGKKYGFGTIMLCHILYDFLTLLTIRYVIG